MTWAVAAGALAVSLVATPACIRIAKRSGIVDRPGSLKLQSVPVAYLGGVAVLAATSVGVLEARPSQLIPLGAATLLGLADDIFGLPVMARVAGQVATGVLVAVASPLHLGGLLGTILLVVATVVLINGVNLLDGLDLLAAGVAVVAAATFAVLLPGSGRDIAVALAGGLIGFLFFNRPPARVYLGDSGAYLIGTALTVLLASAWAPGIPLAKGTAALGPLALPLAEVLFALTRRARGRRSVMSGDRAHPYDLLMARGWHLVAVSSTYALVEAMTCAAALTASSLASVTASAAAASASAVAVVGFGAATGALAPRRSSNA